MNTTTPYEPEPLRRGKQFQRQVQHLFEVDPGGRAARREHSIFLPTPPGAIRQRRGRLDVFVDVEAGHVAVIEIKATLWDHIKPQNIRRNLQSHVRQLQDYVDQLYHEEGLDVTACILYPCPPVDPDRQQAIEQFFDELAIMVVWIEGCEGETSMAAIPSTVPLKPEVS